MQTQWDRVVQTDFNQDATTSMYFVLCTFLLLNEWTSKMWIWIHSWKYVKSFQFPNHAEHFLFSYFSLSNGPPVWAKRFPTESYCLNHFLISEPLILWWSLSLSLMIYHIIIIIIWRSFSNSLLFQRGWLLPLRPHLPG